MTLVGTGPSFSKTRSRCWRLLPAAGVAAILATGCETPLDIAASESSPLQRRDLGAPGAYAIGHTDFVLDHDGRPVAVDVWYPVDSDSLAADAPEATYPIDPYFQVLPVSRSSDWEPYGVDRAYQDVSPAAGGGFPLVLFSPGWAAPPNSYLFAGARLASHGYVVAAIQHYGEGWWPWSEGWHDDSVTLTNRPLDLSFVLDALVARSDDPDDLLASTIDAERVAAGGHSFGGYTALVLAGGDDSTCDAKFNWDYGSPTASCVTTVPDPRIKAVFVYDAALQLLRFEEMQRIAVPLISINQDPSSAPEPDWLTWGLRLHAAAPGPHAFRVDIAPATHLAFSGWCETTHVYRDLGIYGQADFDALAPWGCDADLEVWLDLHRVTTKYTLAFLETYLRGVPGYNQELTRGHAADEPTVELWRAEDCDGEMPLPSDSPTFAGRVDHDSACIEGAKNPAILF